MTDPEQGGFRTDRWESFRKKYRVYMGFMDLGKTYDRVNKEALWQVLRVYDVHDKLLNGIKSIYITSLTCVRVKGGG